MTPRPRFASWDAFNVYLVEHCHKRQGDILRGHRESIGERFVRDHAALMTPPPAPFDACDKLGTRINSLSLVRYQSNDYAVPVAYGHQDVWVRGYVHEGVIGCGAEVIARHPRSYDQEDRVFDPIHYLALLEQKIGALDQAAPLADWKLPELRDPAPSPGGAHGQGRQAGIRPGPAASGDLRSRGAPRCGAGCPAPGRDRLRRRKTPCAVPYRATSAQTRPGYLSLSATGQRGDHGRRQLYELVGWRRVMTDTPQVLLAHHLKTLKLPSCLREYDKLARPCAAEGVDHVRYLVRLTELERIDRERRRVERRIRQARFPAVKSLDSFDFKAIPSLNKMRVLELARCEYVERRENVIALGNSGTGKTHIALGLAACQKGISVGFITAAALVHELMEARDEKRLLRLQKQLATYRLLIIDELGFVPLSKTGAELLFEVFSQRYERGSTLVTSNLPFDEWTEIFGSERLTGALLDRLTHPVHLLEMKGESYRLNQSRKRRKSPTTPA